MLFFFRTALIMRIFTFNTQTWVSEWAKLRRRRCWKVDHHISDRFLPLFVAVWTGFQVKWVGASMGWDPLLWKYIFRRADCDLVHQTDLSANRPPWCDVRCVWTTCSSSIRIHFHVDTKIYFEYSVDRLKKVKEAIRTTNNLIVICREWTDFGPYNCYITRQCYSVFSRCHSNEIKYY